MTQVDFMQLKERDFEEIVYGCEHEIVMFNSPSFYNRIKAHFTKQYKENRYFTMRESMLKWMNLTQLKTIQDIIPATKEDVIFTKIMLTKIFHEELDEKKNSQLSPEERRANLIKIYQYAKKNLHKKHKSLQSVLLEQVLQNGITLSN